MAEITEELVVDEELGDEGEELITEGEESELEEVTDVSIEQRMKAIRSYPLALTSIKKFQDIVRADIDSISNRIMADEEQIAEFQKKLDRILSDKRIKAENWENHIFYKFFEKQKEINQLLIKVSTIKSLYAQYLINVIMKLSELADTIRKEFVEIERLKAEKDLVDKMWEHVKQNEQKWMDNYNKNIEMRFEGINKLFSELQKAIMERDSKIGTSLLKISEIDTKLKAMSTDISAISNEYKKDMEKLAEAVEKEINELKTSVDILRRKVKSLKEET